MHVQDAKAIAREWVLKEASNLPGFHGAFLAGSITSVPDDAVLSPTSDIDVKIIVEAPPDTGGPQKFVVHDTIFDVAYAPTEDVRSPEAVLGNYYTAVHFVRPSLLLDPSGKLRAIQQVVAREYPRRHWVHKRCEHARAWAEDVLSPAATVQDQVGKLLLALVLASHVVLVADLRNPTVRKCLVSLRGVLTDYGHASLHERVLAILGSASMDRRQVEALFSSCVETFDVASVIRTTPFPYASNIDACARPIAIEGGREMITAGFHREAVLWVTAVHTWCQTAIHNDASDDIRSRYTPLYECLLEQLGVPTAKEVAERNEGLRQLVPDLWKAAEEIIATNPAIRD